jgi:hypothetical protein
MDGANPLRLANRLTRRSIHQLVHPPNYPNTMTSYRIQVGYNSAQDLPEVGEYMLGALDALQEHPQLIVDEVLRLEPHRDRELLDEYAASYRKPVNDLTVRVDQDEERDNLPIIVQLASGGEPGRSTKEALRRAVCRLVMEHCHRNAMEVSISVG